MLGKVSFSEKSNLVFESIDVLLDEEEGRSTAVVACSVLSFIGVP